MAQNLYPNIEAERARRNLSVEAVATQLGVTRKTFYNWVRRGKIPQKKAEILSELFNVSTDYLLSKAPEQPEQSSKQSTLDRVIEQMSKM